MFRKNRTISNNHTIIEITNKIITIGDMEIGVFLKQKEFYLWTTEVATSLISAVSQSQSAVKLSLRI